MHPGICIYIFIGVYAIKHVCRHTCRYMYVWKHYACTNVCTVVCAHVCIVGPIAKMCHEIFNQEFMCTNVT